MKDKSFQIIIITHRDEQAESFVALHNFPNVDFVINPSPSQIKQFAPVNETLCYLGDDYWNRIDINSIMDALISTNVDFVDSKHFV